MDFHLSGSAHGFALHGGELRKFSAVVNEGIVAEISAQRAVGVAGDRVLRNTDGRSEHSAVDEDFFVRVNQREIQSMEYFVEEIAEYRIEEGLPLENGQWQQLETAALALWPALTEVKPEKETLWQRLFPLPEPLDGGDSSRLVFHWDTPEGIVSIEYSSNNDDPKAQQLFALLHALRDTAKGE